MCGPYAVSYLAGLLGDPRTPEEVEGFDASYRDGAFYPEKALGIHPVWRMYGGGRQIPGGIMFGFSPGFRLWCRAYAKTGCVGFAHVFLTERIGHAAVLLEADEDGVLLADPARGLVRDRWGISRATWGNPPRGTPFRRQSLVQAARLNRPPKRKPLSAPTARPKEAPMPRTPMRAPFFEAPCRCVVEHTPKVHAVEFHHVYPTGEQVKRHGKMLYPEIVSLCPSGHTNVHFSLSRLLKGEAFRLGNRYLQAVAERGLEAIRTGRLAPESEDACSKD